MKKFLEELRLVYQASLRADSRVRSQNPTKKKNRTVDHASSDDMTWIGLVSERLVFFQSRQGDRNFGAGSQLAFDEQAPSVTRDNMLHDCESKTGSAFFAGTA